MSDSFFAIPLNDDDLAAPPPPRRKTITRSGSADNLMLHFSSMGVDLSGGPLSAALDLLEEDNSEQQRPRVSLHKTSSSPFLVQPVGSSLKEAGLMSVWTSSSGTSAADNNSEGDTNLIIDCHPSSSSLSRTTTNRSSAPSEGERTSSTSTGMDEDSTGSMTEILLDKIKLDAFRQWIVAFCTVDFDLEFGQALECIFPPLDMSDSEKKNICFSAFPDSNSSAHVGDSCFSFRMRSGSDTSSIYHCSNPNMGSSPSGSPTLPRSKNVGEQGGSKLPLFDEQSAPESRHRNTGVMPLDTDGYTYGYVFFRQQSDNEIRRGFFQKSLVILSPHPWKGLFSHMVRVMGTKFMDCLMKDRKTMCTTPSKSAPNEMGSVSRALFRRAYTEIAAWPSPPSQASPLSGYSPIYFKLPFLNTCRSFCFPPNPSFPLMHDVQRPKLQSSSRPHSSDSLDKYSESSTTTSSSAIQIPQRSKTPPTILSSYLSSTLGHTLRQSESTGSLQGHNVLYNRPNPAFLPPILCTTSRFYELFSRSLEMMWICWELMVLGEPVLVIADNPKSASDTIWGLVELIKPIPFGGDFRPYFTIQDSDFKSISNRNRAIPTGLVLGVTNPVFSKALENWPHLIKVAKVPTKAAAPPTSMTPEPSAEIKSNPAMMKNFIQTFGRTSPTPGTNSARSSAVDRLSGIDLSVIQTVTTKHKSFLSKDKNLLKDIVEAAITGQKAQHLNNMIRRHFAELTDRFLQPLNRYFESLIVGNPMSMTLSNLRSRPDIRPFKQDVFMKMMEQSPPALSVALKRSSAELYKTFLKSPNFASWLQHRTADTYREWRKRYIIVLCETDIVAWSMDKSAGGGSDVECVDILLRIRDELNRYAPYFILQDDRICYSNTTLPLEIDPESSRSPSRSSSPSQSLLVSHANSPVFNNNNSSSINKDDSINNTNVWKKLGDEANRYPMQHSLQSSSQSNSKQQPSPSSTISHQHFPTKTVGIGCSIPSADQFERLLFQSDLILKSILPPELHPK